MARIKDQSVRDVVAAADIVEVVSQRTSLRKAGLPVRGPLPLPRGAHPELLRQRRRQALPLLRLRPRAATSIRFVQETENLDFVGRDRVRWPSASASRSSTRRPRRRQRPHGRAASGCTALLDQAAAFYERVPLGVAGRASRCARTCRARARRGGLRASSGSGCRRGTGLARKAREKGFTQEELRAAGLANQRGNDYFPQRLMFPLADARGRIIGFQARKLRDDDPLAGRST